METPRRRPRIPDRVRVPVYMSRKERDLLSQFAQLRNTDASSVARRAILNALAAAGFKPEAD